jgi:3-dehydroquinate dehydratase II
MGANSLQQAKVLVLSGPNLHRLGKREPEIYGSDTLEDVHRMVSERAVLRGALTTCRQSNHEGALVEWIGAAEDEGFAGILINPGAYTHTSYAIYDAIRGCGLPVIEVHISNPDAREPFRRESKVAPACLGRVAGFGTKSYILALDGLLDSLAPGGVYEIRALG